MLKVRFWFLLFAGVLLSTVLVRSPSFAEDADGAFKLDARATLNAYQGMVEEHLGGVLDTLKVLAATDDAMSGDWQRLKGPLGQLAKGVPTSAAVWFARPDGSYFTVEKGLTDQSLKDRDYFPTLLAGNDVNNALVVSKSTGQRSVIVATPIMKDGKVIGAVGTSISVEKLSKAVDERTALPDGVIFYALDARGQAALHRASSLIFAFPSDMGSDTLKSSVEKMLADHGGVLHYAFNGKETTAVFAKSKATGWVFVIGVRGPIPTL